MKQIAIAVASTILVSPMAFAQPQYVSKANTEAHVTTFAGGSVAGGYWTPERLKAAKPLPLPKATFGATVQGDEQQTLATQGKPQSTDGSGPTVKVAPDTKPLFQPENPSSLGTQLEGLSGDASSIQPQDEGTFRAPYTTAFAEAGFPDLEKSYAWRTAGKLYFTINGAGYQCSASVIQRRILVTAGHCVHEGNGSASGWHNNFLFIPAFDSGSAPFKTWNWDFVTTTGTWFSGGGGVPNAADYAMIQVRDQPFFFGGPALRVGDVVGWLGWQTLSLSRNHTTKLGYPCNFAGCVKMVQSESGNFRNVYPNNVEYGSDMRGGSSGGPWVQNFNASCPAEGCGLNQGWNRVVGVTSYGYISTDPRIQGASIPDNRWIDLWNLVCGRRAGNCS